VKTRLVVAMAALMLFLSPARVRAQQSAPPPIIVEGLDVLRTTGADAALDVWMKGWPPASAAEGKAQLLRGFTDVEAVTGRVTGYDSVGSADWGPHTRRLYFTLLGKDRPSFLRIDVYQTGGVWKVLNITLNTDAAEVFPPGLLMPGRP